MTAPAADPTMPLVPDYDGPSLAGVLPAAAEVLGVPVPLPDSVPSAVQRRKQFDLPDAERVCVVLVDGVGWELLVERGGHAPFMRNRLSQTQVLDSGFPTTTATSMAMFGTGRTPGRTGLVGYTLRDPQRDVLVNMLTWPGVERPQDWQIERTVFERFDEAGVPVLRVGPPHFEGSGLTQAALRGGQFAGATSFEEGVDATIAQLQRGGRQLVYLYWGDVDRVGHHFGWQSAQWGDALAAFDYQLGRLASRLPSDTLLLVTADHGMVDVPFSARRDVADLPNLARGVKLVGGEPRAIHLYCEDGAANEVADRWREELGDDAWVYSRNEVVAAGWLGQFNPRTTTYLGDVIVAARGLTAVVDSRTQTPTSLKLVGLHGSLTSAELRVPLLVDLI